MFMPPQEVFLSSKPYLDYGLRNLRLPGKEEVLVLYSLCTSWVKERLRETTLTLFNVHDTPEGVSFLETIL
jgi:hypothetical protein